MRTSKRKAMPAGGAANALRLGVLALAAALATACSMAPKYERPEAPVAAQYPAMDGAQDVANQEPTQQTPAASDIAWQNYFNDPSLQRLIALALENNRDLRVAVQNVEAVRAQYQVQRSYLLPSLNGTASATRQRSVLTGQYANTFSVGLAISAWEIDFFGRIASLKDAALANYLASDEARKAAQITLVSSVASSWMTLLADEELLDLAQRTLAAQEESLRLTKVRFDNGVSSELAYQQALGQYEATAAAHAQIRQQRAVDENALVLLLGQDLPQDIRSILADKRAPRLSELPAFQELPTGLPSDLLIRRPDIRQAEQLLIAANANIGAARAAFFPNISLTVSGGSTSSELKNLFDNGTWGFSLAPQLVLPIFNAGRNRANLEISKAQREIAVAQYEKSIQTAFSEVADALAGKATLGEQLRALRAQTDATARQVFLADQLYRNGISDYMSYLDAQRSYFAVQQSAVQTELAELQNRVLLYKVLGGGWQEESPSEDVSAAPRANQGATRPPAG